MPDTPRKAPPPPLDLLQHFVNTSDIEDGSDQLSSPLALRDWLVDQHLAPAAIVVTHSDLARTVAVREGLRALMLANNGEPADAGLIAALNATSAALPLRPSFAPGDGAHLESAAAGVDAVLAQFCSAVVTSTAAGTWRRMKACRSHTCEWAFYDHSRNGSAAWCTMAVCGNRAKARGYRQRRTNGGT